MHLLDMALDGLFRAAVPEQTADIPPAPKDRSKKKGHCDVEPDGFGCLVPHF